jgi:hypothetical protein
MCDLVIVGLHASTAEQARGSPPHGLAVTLCGAKSVSGLIPGDYRTLLIARGGCSCGLWYGRKIHDDTEKRRRKYEAKGWTRAKIERALAASARHPLRIGLVVEIRSWLADLTTRANRPSYVVVVDASSHGVDDSPIEPGPGISCQQLLTDDVPGSYHQLVKIHPTR